MAQLRAKELREQDAEKLRQTLFDLRSELSKLRGTAARGLNQKQVGKIRRARKDVAKVLTVMHEKGIPE
jgi:ribosomal protein L29